MAVLRIAVIGGDGIGPEVIDQAIRAAEAAARKHDSGRTEVEPAPVEHGLLQAARPHAARGRLGATRNRTTPSSSARSATPPCRTRSRFTNCCLPMRRKFDQYVNLRPAYLFAGVPCPLVGKKPGEIDMLVYRENTEGEYAPVGGNLYPGTENEIAVQTGVFTRRGCERILRAAFDAARKRPRKKLTSITKSNAQVWGMGLWDDVFNAVRKDYPDVREQLAARRCRRDGLRPQAGDRSTWWWRSNLFGDILTDLSAPP